MGKLFVDLGIVLYAAMPDFTHLHVHLLAFQQLYVIDDYVGSDGW